ncbi:phytochrome-like protein cph1 [Abditibacteriota bacterium]|nr:phytochrome-like protein cph1 [Abditibacteriota bacterium]
MDFFHNLFSGVGFIPRAQCGAWTTGLIRLHNLSDFFIWTAYLAIPLVLAKFAYSRRRDLPFRQLFWLFGLFIFACGTTHLMDIVLFYNPLYRLSGLIKLITAVASWGTVAALYHVVPRALQMRSPDDFEREIQQRQQVEASLYNEIEQHRQTEAALQAEIAHRKRLEAEWEHIFELSPDKLCVTGFDGFFKRINPMWENSLGYSREELLAHPLLEFVHPDDAEKTLAEEERNRSGENTDSFENRFRCKDGSYKWLSWRARAIPAEHVIYAAARDITERKKTEQILQSTMHQLERSNRELQDFASIASHDLQEPLRAIQAFSERLQNKHGDMLNEEGRDYLTRMHNAATRMRSSIQDLLAYSRVTTRVLPFTPTNLATTTKAVLADLVIHLEETGGHVEVGDLPVIDADAMQMRQLFQNLIANGLKFHRDDEPPVIQVYAQPPASEDSENGEEWVWIVVKDNGIGFDEKFSERIFSPFERLHNKNKYSGTGIGLAICRKIVERHEGHISVKSVPGEGSQFVIALPIKQPENDLSPAHPLI